MEGRSIRRNAAPRPQAGAEVGSTSRGGVAAVARGIRVFEAVAEAGGATSLAAVTVQVGLPKATVHRLLQTFVEHGYVETSGDGLYRAGGRVLAIAAQVTESRGYAGLIGPVLQELQRHTPETIHFGILSGLEAVYIEKLEGRRPYQMASRIGKVIPLHSTAIGKAILTFLPDEQRISLIRRTRLVRRTERTITSRRDLDEELRRTRRLGYALDDQENEEGIRCVGAPVFDHTGRVIGAISVSAPVFDLSLEQVRTLAPVLVAAARAASEALGARSDGFDPRGLAGPRGHRRPGARAEAGSE